MLVNIPLIDLARVVCVRRGNRVLRGGMGRGWVPSKWPHLPFVSIATKKQRDQKAQLAPDTPSSGTLDGRVLVVVLVVVDICRAQ
jgi:hypothetical protein